jgi:hypothetical protein
MELLLYIVCATFGIFLGCIIAKGMQSSCKHKWNLIESGQIMKYNVRGQEIVKGFIKFYECEHCKKMKREKAELN